MMIGEMMKAILVILFVSLSFLFSQEYHVSKADKNEVKFISDAPLEDFEGVTDKIDGYLYFENGDFTVNSQLYFEIDLKSLDTGIGLRNRHMRDNYLHTDKYPSTHFKGKIVKAEKTADNQFNVTSEGVIFIHGIERPLTVNGKLTTMDDRIQIQCQFEVKLSDFNIPIPQLMFMKINEVMDLRLNFYLQRFDAKDE